jgi:hypothetical protein
MYLPIVSLLLENFGGNVVRSADCGIRLAELALGIQSTTINKHKIK